MILQRVRKTVDGTFGVLLSDNKPFAVTLELPWRDNLKNLSCIPAGVYMMKKVHSRKYGDVYEVTGVQDRTGILFHWGNTMKDSKGCVLIGQKFGEVQGRPAVLESRVAFKNFMTANLYRDVFPITILDN